MLICEAKEGWFHHVWHIWQPYPKKIQAANSCEYSSTNIFFSQPFQCFNPVPNFNGSNTETRDPWSWSWKPMAFHVGMQWYIRRYVRYVRFTLLTLHLHLHYITYILNHIISHDTYISYIYYTYYMIYDLLFSVQPITLSWEVLSSLPSHRLLRVALGGGWVCVSVGGQQMWTKSAVSRRFQRKKCWEAMENHHFW